MSKILMIGDFHNNHHAIIRYCDRPFNHVEQMRIYMIKQYNSIVSNNDKVFNFGDVSLYDTEDFVSQLKGHKSLIMGNHDMNRKPSWWMNIGFKEVFKYPIILRGKIICSHRQIPYELLAGGFVNIHAHNHNDSSVDTDKHFCVSVERLNYLPINIDEIIKIKKWKL